MSTWPFWVYIGLLIFGIIVRIAMVGKETKTKFTAGGAVITLIANGVMIWWLINVMHHLC